MLLTLAARSAQAIDYSFPGPTMPAGCSGGNGSYTCGALAFAAGDTLSVAEATAVTVNGALSIGADALINASGSGANLSFNISGAVTVGAGATLNANVASSAAVTIGANSTVGGSISTTTGAVSVGASTLLTGNISTVDGGVTLGAGTGVSGSITTSNTGAISAGASSSVGGNISSATGAIDIGAGSSVGGSISSSVNGAIGLGSTVSVAGGISSATGAITVGERSVVNGPIASTVEGAISLGASSQAGSTVTSTSGAIDIGAGGSVAALLSTKGPGLITIGDGALINSVYCGATGDQSCVKNNSSQPMPPASPSAAGGAAGAFDCLETGSNALWSAAARKPLTTKLAGRNFSVDIAALNTDGSLVGNYAPAGGSARYVRVELLDDSTPPASCSAAANAVATQIVAFSPGVSSGAAGRTQSGNFNLNSAYKVLRCRVTECANSTCGSVTALVPSCSSDQFSVRPQALTLQTSALAPAPSPTATPVIQAGANFALSASASASAPHTDVVLALDQSKLSAQIPGQASSIQSGGVVGTLTPLVLTVNAGPVSAVYTEVGYLYLAPGAFRNDTYTAVDSAAGDCINDTAGNHHLSDTLIDGKYGCSIGNLTPVSFGRFMPHHFDSAIEAGVPMPCPGALTCAPAGYVYAAQPFGVTITARNLADATTRNYSGDFSHAVTLQAWDAPGSTVLHNPPAIPAGSMLRPSAVPAASFAAGVANVNGAASAAYVFPFAWPSAGSTLAGPTTIYVRAIETPASSADGLTSARASTSVEGGVTVVTGRLLLGNNYGSELLPLPINVTAQYWDGAQFVASTGDNASIFNATDIVLSNCNGALGAGAGACIGALSVAAAPASVVLVAGAARFKLDAPGPGYTGSLEVNIGTFPWLPSNKARLTLGLYKSGPVIYSRELY
ncbi:MAG: hypothetical protein H7335_12715 [Massilia sp.]|nr:hypothetical protein [Massilia sp.]